MTKNDEILEKPIRIGFTKKTGTSKKNILYYLPLT